jgi:hypothetical protein
MAGPDSAGPDDLTVSAVSAGIARVVVALGMVLLSKSVKYFS